MKYTLGTKVFDADNLTAAREYAKSQGWVAANVVSGDWVTYPESGHASSTTTATATSQTTAPTTTTTTPKTTTTTTPTVDMVAKLHEQIRSWNQLKGTNFSLDLAGLRSYLNATNLTESAKNTLIKSYQDATAAPKDTTGGWSQAQIAEYNDYVNLFNSGLYPNLPSVTSPEDYFQKAGQIEAYGHYYFSTAKASLQQYDEWIRFQAFHNQYGDLNDFAPKNFVDFINNYSKAQQQLNAWETEAGPEATGFADAQIREYKDFLGYASRYGEPGDWWPVDIGDFFTNYSSAQQQLSIWKGLAAGEEKYALTPEEEARRREEAYQASQYAQEEAYREQPRYPETFTGWIEGQSGVSQSLKAYIEREYPSLRSEYEAGLGRLTGFPTREEARAEAQRRETGWSAWLTEKTPEITQDYYMQRPTDRGERMWMQEPTLRTANW